MKKKIIFGTVALMLIAGIFLGFAFFSRNKNNLPKYKKEAVKKGDIQALVVTSGTLNPMTVVDVGSQVSGKLAKIYVDFNSQVKAGQLVAELDQELFLTRVHQNEANYKSSLASLEKAKVTLDSAQKKHERALNLFEKNLISFEEKEAAETQYYNAKADLQSAEARLDQANSQLESSQVDLAYTVIRSPIDGVVITRNVNVGQTMAASFQAPVLFKIANDLSKMQVECNVDEADIGKVKEDQKVTFTVDAFPNENFSGRVTQVRYSPEVIQNVVTYTTIVELENPELKLRPGMTATVSMVVGEAKDKLLVPNAALRYTPALSQEEMAKIFEDMRKEWQARRAGQSQSDAPEPARQPGREGEPGSPGTERRGGSTPGLMAMQGGMPGGRMQQSSRVWVEDENMKLRPIMVRTGVTDNTYTEIIGGNLKEGQEVITGEATTLSSNPNPGLDLRRSGMMFIRR